MGIKCSYTKLFLLVFNTYNAFYDLIRKTSNLNNFNSLINNNSIYFYKHTYT